MAKHTVKQVDINGALLKEYKPEDLVHYVSVKLLSALRDAAQIENPEVAYGELLVSLVQFAKILAAADKELNDIDDSPNVAL